MTATATARPRHSDWGLGSRWHSGWATAPEPVRARARARAPDPEQAEVVELPASR